MKCLSENHRLARHPYLRADRLRSAAEAGVDLREEDSADAGGEASRPHHSRVPHRASGPPGACWSTTTRTPGDARWRPSTRCGRSPWRTVSAPVTWEELERGIQIEDFRLDNMPERVRQVGDLYRPLLLEPRPYEAGAVPVSLPIPLDYAPMEADSVLEMPDRSRAGSTSPNGTASAASAFATASRSSCSSKAGQAARSLFPRDDRGARAARGEAVRARRRAGRPHRRQTLVRRLCCSGFIRPQSRFGSSRAKRPRN